MKTTALTLSLCTTLAASTTALAADPALPPGVVAMVNGQPLQRTLLDELVRARSASGASAEAQQERSRMLDDLVNTELASQRAQSSGVAARPQTRAELSLAHKMLLGQHLLRRMVADMQIDDATLQARYRDLPPDVQVDASHILVSDEALARRLIEQLQQGTSFNTLAAQHSLDMASRTKGGALGPLPLSDLELPFANAAMALKPGQTTREPVHTEHGWHIIKLGSRRTIAKRPFETLKPALRTQIVSERLQAQMTQWKKDAKVTVLKAP